MSDDDNIVNVNGVKNKIIIGLKYTFQVTTEINMLS